MLSSVRLAFKVVKPTTPVVSKFFSLNKFSQIKSFQTVQKNLFSNLSTTRSLVNNNNFIKPGIIHFKNHLATVADTPSSDGKLSIEELDKLFASEKEFYRTNFLQVNLELLEACVPFFEGMTWQDAIKMDSNALKEKGCESFFVRSRLRRHFDMVKCKIEGREHNPASSEWKEHIGEENAEATFDVKLLDDLPSFLHSLGGSLGIFAAYFHGKTWKEIVRMTDPEFKEIGIKGRSVRRSMRKRLRVFKKFAVSKGLIEDFPDPEPPTPEVETVKAQAQSYSI
ncbi:3249_t:CDS:2 [Diversispora eburnea]|uniref:3249_t:CDS:1 n=1 Tax=Diversispora eburnea TaxID=1213867 RepID=A0A9N8YKD2_9GLOM|nr:3249_t:CDS:2 [Diversispora eburnea]